MTAEMEWVAELNNWTQVKAELSHSQHAAILLFLYYFFVAT